MCKFCEGKEEIKRQPDFFQDTDTTVSLRVDEERATIMELRVSIGSQNYTLPIQIFHCMFCGRKIKEREED